VQDFVYACHTAILVRSHHLFVLIVDDIPKMIR
jgi:hypothetical protein